MIRVVSQARGGAVMNPVLKGLGLFFLVAGLFCLTGCLDFSFFGKEKLPDDPVQRAAVLGVRHSYRESTMWEISKAKVLKVQRMIPAKGFIQEHDPKEVYCVCVEYRARYKVPWATEDHSDWETTVRNILVIKTRGDNYMALRPSGICPAFCK